MNEKTKNTEITGIVFNIQRFSLFDGPGVRTVVFLKGCPLSCLWCHNPEGVSTRPQILYNKERCIGCGDCADACPEGLHFLQGVTGPGSDSLRLEHSFVRTGCTGCGSCQKVCPSGALSLAGRRMRVTEVIDTVMRDVSLYRESGGGMTLSGGEPLLQTEFALALLRAAREEGLHTCVETSGYADEADLLHLAEYTDLFYYDYKATGEEHERLIGVPSARILANLKSLNERGARVVLRCPIVPGANENPEHIRGIADTAGAYGCIEEVHLEPYHRLGLSKAESLGQDKVFDTELPERERLSVYCEQIQEQSGKPCRIS